MVINTRPDILMCVQCQLCGLTAGLLARLQIGAVGHHLAPWTCVCSGIGLK